MQWTPIEIPPLNDAGQSDMFVVRVFVVWVGAGWWRPAFYDGDEVCSWRDAITGERIDDVTHYIKEMQEPEQPALEEGQGGTS